MNIDLITKEDFERFKIELLKDIRELIDQSAMKNGASKSWLKGAEVQKLLGISTGTLQNLRVNGTLPYSKIGGLLYYKYDDIHKLMNDKREVK